MSALPRPRRLLAALLPLVGCGGDIVLEDAQNYAYTASFTTGSQVVAAATDCTVDWSGLTMDIQDHDVDPTADISKVSITRFRAGMTQEQVLDGIGSNSLEQADIDASVDFSPSAGETSANFSEFGFFGTPVDPETDIVDDGKVYLASALTGLYLYRMFAFFEPTDGAEGLVVEIDAQSADLEFAADVDAGDPIPHGKSTVVDWRDLTQDGLDNSFFISNIDSLMLARYSLSLPEVEDQFFDLELIAEQMFQAEVGGMGEYDLADLTDSEGNVFQGFEGDGTWLLALRCSTCTNPAPLFLGVME